MADEGEKKKQERISGRVWAKENGLEQAFNEASGSAQLELEAGLRAERDRESVIKRRDKAQWLVNEANEELKALDVRVKKMNDIAEALSARQLEINAT